MTDLEVMAIVAESACIDSESWLFSKLQSNYRAKFPNLIDRTRFNRRRKQLRPYLLEYSKRLSSVLTGDSDVNLVDSMPCPIVKNNRERSYSICKEDPENPPAKGYSAVDKRFYIGYKFHLITSDNGVFQDFQLTPANVHDICTLQWINLLNNRLLNHLKHAWV